MKLVITRKLDTQIGSIDRMFGSVTSQRNIPMRIISYAMVLQ